MKRILVVAFLGFMLASIGSSCAQPRGFVGGGIGFGRPRHFYGPRPEVFVQPPVFIAPRPNIFVPRPWGWGHRHGWRRGC